MTLDNRNPKIASIFFKNSWEMIGKALIQGLIMSARCTSWPVKLVSEGKHSSFDCDVESPNQEK